MKPPKCKLCGTAHYSHEEHKFAGSPRTASKVLKVNKLVLNTVDEVQEIPATIKRSSKGEGRRGKQTRYGDDEAAARGYPIHRRPAQGAATTAGLAPGPLTPAEKQKAYRLRHGDKVRKRNRERMRNKRNGNIS